MDEFLLLPFAKKFFNELGCCASLWAPSKNGAYIEIASKQKEKIRVSFGPHFKACLSYFRLTFYSSGLHFTASWKYLLVRLKKKRAAAEPTQVKTSVWGKKITEIFSSGEKCDIRNIPCFYSKVQLYVYSLKF